MGSKPITYFKNLMYILSKKCQNNTTNKLRRCLTMGKNKESKKNKNNKSNKINNQKNSEQNNNECE